MAEMSDEKIRGNTESNFRPMRREKRKISIEETQKLLFTERRGVLAVNGDGGYPYAIPVNFIYDKDAGKIYFHGAKAGHKVDALEKSDKVCFTVYGDESVREEEWAPFVKSAVAFGRLRLMPPGIEAENALRKMARKYYPNEELIDLEMSQSGGAVQMYEIEIEHLTGKEVQEK